MKITTVSSDYISEHNFVKTENENVFVRAEDGATVIMIDDEGILIDIEAEQAPTGKGMAPEAVRAELVKVEAGVKATLKAKMVEVEAKVKAKVKAELATLLKAIGDPRAAHFTMLSIEFVEAMRRSGVDLNSGSAEVGEACKVVAGVIIEREHNSLNDALNKGFENLFSGTYPYLVFAEDRPKKHWC